MATESVKIDTEIVNKVRVHVAASKQTIGGFFELSASDSLSGGVIGKIKEDSGLFLAWQANIAMAYIDSERWYKKRTGKKTLNAHDKHSIANEAAKHFLELLIK